MEQTPQRKPESQVIGRMKPDHAAFHSMETLMKVRLSLLALLFALATGTAFAHGNKFTSEARSKKSAPIPWS